MTIRPFDAKRCPSISDIDSDAALSAEFWRLFEMGRGKGPDGDF
jgi:hypothetical protein